LGYQNFLQKDDLYHEFPLDSPQRIAAAVLKFLNQQLIFHHLNPASSFLKLTIVTTMTTQVTFLV